MFDSCRGHSQTLYPSRFRSFRDPARARRDFLNSCFLNSPTAARWSGRTVATPSWARRMLASRLVWSGSVNSPGASSPRIVSEYGAAGTSRRAEGEGTHLQAANHVRLDNYWGTGRTEAFSDGVFAIAITLLILEINVPETAFDNLWRGIAEQWPSYLAYATSFITIGGIWLAHHGIFRRLQYANTPLMLINLLLLMAVSFLPFPTKLMAEAIHNPDAERAAVIFYGGSLLVISCLISALWGSVARDRHLLRPEVSAEGVQCDRTGNNPECRLLPRRYRAGATGTQDRRVRLSRHRHRGCAARTRRHDATTFNDVAVERRPPLVSRRDDLARVSCCRSRDRRLYDRRAACGRLLFPGPSRPSENARAAGDLGV